MPRNGVGSACRQRPARVPWLAALRNATQFIAPSARHDVCEVNVNPSRKPTRIDNVRCMVGGPSALRSHMMVTFVTPAQRSRWPMRSSDTWVHAGQVPTILPLAERLRNCSILILNMDFCVDCKRGQILGGQDPPAFRQSLVYDLPHALRMLPQHSVVFARSSHACHDPGRQYQINRKMGKKIEQCWVERWEELVKAGVLSSILPGGQLCGGLASCRQNGRAQIHEGCAAHPANGTRSHLGAWCVARVKRASICHGPLSLPPLLAATAERSVVRFQDNRGAMVTGMPSGVPQARYFSVLDCKMQRKPLQTASDRICVLFKDHTRESLVAMATSADGLRFGKWTTVLKAEDVEDLPRGGLMHNLAVLQEAAGNASRSSWVLMGGTHRYEPHVRLRGDRNQVVVRHRGIWLVRKDHLGPQAPQRHTANERLVLDGYHPGCIEERGHQKFPYLVRAAVSPLPFTASPIRAACEFDGRLALVRFQGQYLLFARANMAAQGGQRFVQMASSADLITWSPLRQISIAGYRAEEGDVYFFAPQVNPVLPTSLLAIFPIVHRLHGCLGIALSLDGLNWSRMTPLITCGSVGERTLSQPAAPAMVIERNEANSSSFQPRSMWVYVHENVGGASFDKFLPVGLREHREREAARGTAAQLVRYSLPLEVLERWTHRALRSLKVSE